MYRCSECGCEYNEKPDFCECGNDIFIEIKSEEKKYTPEFRLKPNPKDVLSWIIFGVLIIISVLVLIFFPRIKVAEAPQQKNDLVQKVSADIPSINSFWIDCKPQTVTEQVTEQIQNIIKPPKKEEPIVKTKSLQTVKKQSPQSVQHQKNTVVKQTQKNVAQTTIPKTNKSQPKQMTYEVANYRTALRQRLLSNLDIYTIEGHGTCGVEFSIDETGKLINRNFSFQSDNKTVNDAVYKMLMRTPKFNPPPDAIVNKKIKLVFELDNESYSIRYAD